jgi:NAD(P)-dependent dehydrogenase (short-subunit alcohol dehydrogenase family)
VLINNAGVMACPLARSPDGWELQFATNHMGHFLLTSLLRPALYAETPARVVCVSSAGHMRAAVDFDDQGGLYLEDCGVSAPAGTAGVTTGYLPHAVDPEAAARLWRVSEDLLGERCA